MVHASAAMAGETVWRTRGLTVWLTVESFRATIVLSNDLGVIMAPTALDIMLDSLRSLDLKELDAAQMTQRLTLEAKALDWLNSDRLDAAIALASILHRDQTRGNRGNFQKTPYIEHPLRNALRLLDFGVKDEDLILAAILHDVIEDGARTFVHVVLQSKYTGELAARALLAQFIGEHFGERVLKLVIAVTNDYLTDEDKSRRTFEEKCSNYFHHVSNSIVEVDVFLVKLSDFIDNATGLYHNDRPERARKTLQQALKYLPLVPEFETRLDCADVRYVITPAAIDEIEGKLLRTRSRLQTIVERGDARG